MPPLWLHSTNLLDIYLPPLQEQRHNTRHYSHEDNCEWPIKHPLNRQARAIARAKPKGGDCQQSNCGSDETRMPYRGGEFPNGRDRCPQKMWCCVKQEAPQNVRHEHFRTNRLSRNCSGKRADGNQRGGKKMSSDDPSLHRCLTFEMCGARVASVRTIDSFWRGHQHLLALVLLHRTKAFFGQQPT